MRDLSARPQAHPHLRTLTLAAAVATLLALSASFVAPLVRWLVEAFAISQ